ncbi:RNA ligase [Bifidobacterium leontopitheci]|uniref:Kinase n=1 Tax=Bifidobacterium leontopitheci TaxID=2650774 RepID=A0A6I1GHI9_9BIFI|nr:RNA ligase [Bifidobacterium leontopitheci]KAB7791120.1 kinase [Bifidobacterium leontopitheci]
MAKLIILRGLPAAGKSTWARAWALDPANTWPHCVISLDEIRLMIAGSPERRDRMRATRGSGFEAMVVAMGRHMVADALDAGWDVVADAQHANPQYAKDLVRLAEAHGALWETRDFDVPLDELLRRNAARPDGKRVPEDYIRSSWKRFHDVMFRPLDGGGLGGNLLERMRADPDVRVTPVRGEADVFVCNFTRDAFLKGRWNERTVNARGLFVDGDGRVVQRGFEKFFAVDETEATRYDRVVAYGDEHPGAFPVRVERKENGFLGLVGAAGEPGRFRFWSKSGQTDYSALIERLFPADAQVREQLWQMLHDWDVTAAFEVLDMQSDRHIVGYDGSGLRLLHLIRNQETFAIDAAHEPRFAAAGGFARPQVVAVCHDAADVAQAIADARRTDREGVVLYFADGWMVKVKSDHYKLVKSLRPMLQRVLLRGRALNRAGETADLARRVIGYANDHGIDLTYERQAFGERDVDMIRVGDIVRTLDAD